MAITFLQKTIPSVPLSQCHFSFAISHLLKETQYRVVSLRTPHLPRYQFLRILGVLGEIDIGALHLLTVHVPCLGVVVVDVDRSVPHSVLAASPGMSYIRISSIFIIPLVISTYNITQLFFLT